MIFESVRLSPVLSMVRQSAAAVVSELALLPRRSSWMLSRTAARARSAQGASQFAAGYAAVRLTRHGDVRLVPIVKTRYVTVSLCLRRYRDSRVQIRPFCPRRSVIGVVRMS